MPRNLCASNVTNNLVKDASLQVCCRGCTIAGSKKRLHYETMACTLIPFKQGLQ